jgi:hypothetical protein
MSVFLLGDAVSSTTAGAGMAERGAVADGLICWTWAAEDDTDSLVSDTL